MSKQLIDSINEYANKMNSMDDLDPLLEEIGEAKLVLLGESSHGTSEFYKIRTELTKRLITEKGFSIVAVEGDWPACQQVNRYIKQYSSQHLETREVLNAFRRWPTWMWANNEIAELIDWLKSYNQSLSNQEKVGFYGLDVYSLWESMDEIIKYLERTNSDMLMKAEEAFSCFEPFNRQSEKYAVSASFFSESCVDEVIELLTKIRLNKGDFSSEEENDLNLEVNALVTANAEKYYRAMVLDDVKSWNIRDEHMVETLNTVRKYYGENNKVIIWEHNTHVGDARATTMKDEGMTNVGQIIREQNKIDDVYIVGFGTYKGTVIAAKQWGVELENMIVPPAEKSSWENLLHKAGDFNKFLTFNSQNQQLFNHTLGHRAIGVVYHPEYEQYGNYVPSKISERYNAFIFIDESSALTPFVFEGVYS